MADKNYSKQDRERLDCKTEQDKEDERKQWKKYEQEAKKEQITGREKDGK